MKSHSIILFLALLLAAFMLSCQQQDLSLVSPDELITLAKKGGNGGGNGGGKGKGDITNFNVQIIIGDAGSIDAPLLSDCPGFAKTDGYHVSFGHTQCLIVKPKWTSPNFNPYELTDDISLEIKKKRGEITQVRLVGQDIIGADGIMHESDAIVINPPVKPDPAGFTFHVHAIDVPLWRLSGHVGGKRVEQIGTISIGDIVYEPVSP